jgi:DNA-binding XRE family transcriptional regulator
MLKEKRIEAKMTQKKPADKVGKEKVIPLD